MYPNPTTQQVVIELDSHDEIRVIELFQIDGKASKTIKTVFFGKAEIDVRDLPKGMYLVRVQTANQFAMKKLVVQ